MQVFIAEDNYYELERLRRQVQSWGSRHGGVSITVVQCVAEGGRRICVHTMFFRMWNRPG